MALLPLGTLLLGSPHYGATLLRVYERKKDRSEYHFFATWASVAVVIALVAGVYNTTVGSCMLTLYLSWAPWHFSGQNYGIASMYLGRRGVSITKIEKNYLRAPFYLSWALILLLAHMKTGDGYGVKNFASSGVSFIQLGIPAEIGVQLAIILGIAFLFAATVSVVTLRRAAPWRDIYPTLCVLGLQTLWFVLPSFTRITNVGLSFEPLSPQFTDYTFYWILNGHFIQYLWVTRFYAKSSGTDRHAVPYFAKTLLVGSAIWGIPLILFVPETFGVRSFDAGLAAVIASAVNIHHFILDGAIWKLRDGRIARILLRGKGSPEELGVPKPSMVRMKWMPVFLAAGLATTFANLVAIYEIEFGFRRAAIALNPDRLRTAAKRLRWVGRDQAPLHVQIAHFDARADQLDDAIHEVERSLELDPTAEAWELLGEFYSQQGNQEAAVRANAEAQKLGSDLP
jgi:tetratricopeptide (TPR) repeat protein